MCDSGRITNDFCATLSKTVRHWNKLCDNFKLLNISISSIWLVTFIYLLKNKHRCSSIETNFWMNKNHKHSNFWMNKTTNILGYIVRLWLHMGTLQNTYDTMDAFHRKTVRQDGRIWTEICATFGKIVRQFPQSHRKINPCLMFISIRTCTEVRIYSNHEGCTLRIDR